MDVNNPKENWILALSEMRALAMPRLLAELLAFRALKAREAPDQAPSQKIIRKWVKDGVGVNSRRKSRAFILSFCHYSKENNKIVNEKYYHILNEQIINSQDLSNQFVGRDPINILSAIMLNRIDIRKKVAVIKKYQSGIFKIIRKHEEKRNNLRELLIISDEGTHGIKVALINQHEEVFSGYLYPSNDVLYIITGKSHIMSKFRLRFMAITYAKKERKNKKLFGIMIRFSDSLQNIVSSTIALSAIDKITKDENMSIIYIKRFLSLDNAPLHIKEGTRSLINRPCSGESKIDKIIDLNGSVLLGKLLADFD